MTTTSSLTVAVLALALTRPGLHRQPATRSGRHVGPTGPSARAATVAARPARSWARLADRVPAPVLHWTDVPEDRPVRHRGAAAGLPPSARRDDQGGAAADQGGGPPAPPGHRLRQPRRTWRLGQGLCRPAAAGPAQSHPRPVRHRRGRPARSRRQHADAVLRHQGGAGPCAGPVQPGPLPRTPRRRQRSWIGAARALGRACSTTGRKIASAMSTTDDALDMDVLRRAVGDRQLTYFGESYGSYLGLVYANMFPGRVRALVIDGIVDAAGAGRDARHRGRAGLRTAGLRRRQLPRAARAAGALPAGRPARCSFASRGHPGPVRPAGRPAPGPPAAPGRPRHQDHHFHVREPDRRHRALAARPQRIPGPVRRADRPGPAHRARRGRPRPAPPWCGALLRLRSQLQAPPGYDTLLEAESGVLCTDGLHAANAAAWPAAAAAADRRARYFGALLRLDHASSARGTPGPRGTATCTGAHSTAAPPRPSW